MIAQLQGLIDQGLAEDEQAPPKQRHTAHRIWERLTQAPYNYTRGESTVRLYVRQQRGPRPEAFFPLVLG